MWSCYESVLSGTDLTTNVAESWNSVNKLSTVAKPNMWGLIRMFQKEESMARAKYTNVMCGRWVDQNPSRTKRTIEKKERLKQLVEKFDHMNLKDYIESVSTFYNED